MQKSVLISIVILVASGGIGLWMALPKPEPSYKGKKLSEWLESLDTPPGNARFGAPGWSDHWSQGNGNAVRQALQQMGSHVVRPLRGMINFRDQPLRLKLISWARRRGLLTFQIDDEWVRHYRAAAACRLADAEIRTQLLDDWIRLLLNTSTQSPQYDEACFCFTMAAIGSLSPSACESLVEASTNASTQLRRYAVSGLAQFRVSQTETVTSALLARLRNDPDGGVQFSALHTLDGMPPTIVPALLRELSEDSVSSRRGCLIVLATFTNEASVIVPAVLRELDDPDAAVRDLATNALKTLSGASTAQAGVN